MKKSIYDTSYNTTMMLGLQFILCTTKDTLLRSVILSNNTEATKTRRHKASQRKMFACLCVFVALWTLIMKKSIYDTSYNTTMMLWLQVILCKTKDTLLRSVILSNNTEATKTRRHKASQRKMFACLCVFVALWLNTDRGCFFPVFWKVDSAFSIKN